MSIAVKSKLIYTEYEIIFGSEKELFKTPYDEYFLRKFLRIGRIIGMTGRMVRW